MCEFSALKFPNYRSEMLKILAIIMSHRERFVAPLRQFSVILANPRRNNRSGCSRDSVIQFVEECAIAGNCETVQEDDGKG